ncbi:MULTISPECIES: mycofactocin biosynthesis glycosyltransferase MftF [Thermocrispum]|uniref:mycofactocin biosynthesis glycosyltransferase MftF n=1 Tax=Thermocrispum TaxID=37924 RepID=UPI00042139F4|nr:MULTISPECIES: mycofactocin biosynthesis glycosyltransferase MftF [Thermocrispum]
MQPVRPGTRLILDAQVRRFHGDRILLGGAPLRLLRLSPAGAGYLRGWLAGKPVGDDQGEQRLARRLIDAGLAHPRPVGGRYSATDVTLVVPVKDDAEGAAAVVNAVGNVADRIVVDDGSAVPLPSAAVRHERPRGPAAARNAGWRLARTELVAFLDADTRPAADWLDAVLPHFDDPCVAAVAPRVRSLPGEGGIARYEEDRSSLDMGAEPGRVQPLSRIGYVPSAALVVRRSALAAVGGFDEDLRYGEDVDFVWRLIDAGYTVRYEPASTVAHLPRPDVRSWLRQRFDYGTSAAPLAQRHPGRLTCAQLTLSSALEWGLAASGFAPAAAAVALVDATRTAARLRRRGIPGDESWRLVLGGSAATGGMLAAAVRRGWWPLAVVTRRGRRVLLASLLPCLLEAAKHPKSVRWAALRIADDIAYGVGVWVGCLRYRTPDPLLPRRYRFSPRTF